MNKINLIFCAMAAFLILACVSKQIGLKENWIDERDVIALSASPVSDWMLKAGRPTLVEINGDTNIYYYNYRPTMYATTIYDSTTIFKTWGTAKETKPGAENSTEIWGSRKNTMQIKVVKDVAISAIITAGPDKKALIRDLNGDLILDPNSGYNSNISEEQKIDGSSDQYKSAYSKLYGKEMITTGASPVAGTNMSPWEYYHYKQQLDSAALYGQGQPAQQPVAEQGQPAQQPAAEQGQPAPAPPAEPETPTAIEPAPGPALEWQ